MKTTFHISSKPRFFIRKSKYYSSINEALKKIGSKNNGEIKLIIHEGIHNCDINMKSNLSIIGVRNKKTKILLKGCIKNENGKCLTVKNVTLVPNKKGISQIGGSLTFVNVNIKRDPKIPQADNRRRLDACISVSKEAVFKANNFKIEYNSFPVIFIAGANTKAVLSGIIIRGAKLSQTLNYNRDNPICVGALEVRNAATLLIENSLIQNNEYIGVCVENNSKMHLRNTAILNTKEVIDTNGKKQFGHNLVVTSNSIVELHDFQCSYAENHGIFVSKAYLTAERGNVNCNQIGISFLDPPTDANYNYVNCFHENVKILGNESRIGTGELPLPDSPPDSFQPDTSLCKTVPWEINNWFILL